MISWIQKYFQHHFRTIFAVLLGVTIISFVVTIGASPGIGRADRRVEDRDFFGYNLSLEQDVQRMMRDGQLSFQLNPSYDYNFTGIEAYAEQRVAALHLADEWHIPAATPAEIETAVRSLGAFRGDNGQFDAAQYQKFRDSLRTNPRGLGEADVARVVAEDVRVHKVEQLIAGPGYVLPSDVKKEIEARDTSWTVATASVDYTAYDPGLKPTDAQLTTAFEAAGTRYDIPPRVVASYADFPATNYLSGITVTEAEVKAYYDQNPGAYPKPADVKPATPGATPPKTDVAADYPIVRPQVEAKLKLERAQKLAIKTASDFTLALYESKVTPATLDAFLAQQKVMAKPLAPFTREAGPAELGGLPTISNEAFKLNAEHFSTEALPSMNGAVVLFWKETQPSRKPLFADVKEKVAHDWIESEKRKRFEELGKSIKSTLETRLKAGDTFDKAVAAAASASGQKIEAKTLAAFTPGNRPQDVDPSVLDTLPHLDKGKVSDMEITADKGIFVYGVDKKAPDLTETNPEYAKLRTEMAGYFGQLKARSYLTELVYSEEQRTAPKGQQ